MGLNETSGVERCSWELSTTKPGNERDSSRRCRRGDSEEEDDAREIRFHFSSWIPMPAGWGTKEEQNGWATGGHRTAASLRLGMQMRPFPRLFPSFGFPSSSRNREAPWSFAVARREYLHRRLSGDTASFLLCLPIFFFRARADKGTKTRARVSSNMLYTAAFISGYKMVNRERRMGRLLIYFRSKQSSGIIGSIECFCDCLEFGRVKYGC